MGENPVERSWIGRFVVGLVVITATFVGGGLTAGLFPTLGVPYGDWIGAGVGAFVALAAFSVLYLRYDASFDGR